MSIFCQFRVIVPAIWKKKIPIYSFWGVLTFTWAIPQKSMLELPITQNFKKNVILGAGQQNSECYVFGKYQLWFLLHIPRESMIHCELENMSENYSFWKYSAVILVWDHKFFFSFVFYPLNLLKPIIHSVLHYLLNRF